MVSIPTIHLSLRVERAYKVNSWSENPPARIRRVIGNIELIDLKGEEYQVINNFHLYCARPGSENFIYSGQRTDLLVKECSSYKLKRREIIMDYASIEVPTLVMLL